MSEHAVEIWEISSRSYAALCTCGWVATGCRSWADAEGRGLRHAEGARVVDSPRSARSTRSSIGHHHELPTATFVDDGGTRRYRARCSCGWISDPVDSAQTVLVWDAHAQDTRQQPERG